MEYNITILYKNKKGENKMTDKTKGVLAYVFSLVGGLIFLFSKDSSKNVKMHSAQSIVIFLGYMILTILYRLIPVYIPLLSTLIYVVYILAIVFGIVKVCREEKPELPVIGEVAKKLFGKQIGE